PRRATAPPERVRASGGPRRATAPPGRVRAWGGVGGHIGAPHQDNQMSGSAVVIALLLAVPAAAFTFWPFVRRRDRPAPLLPLPPDAREQLTEAKRVALAALRELDFEHAAGHVSDADFADLRARYEAEAAVTLRALDALPPASAPKPARPPAPAGRGWRHPAPLGAAARALPLVRL